VGGEWQREEGSDEVEAGKDHKMNHHAFLIKAATMPQFLSSIGYGTARLARKLGGKEYGGIPWRWITDERKNLRSSLGKHYPPIAATSAVRDVEALRSALLGAGVLGSGGLGAYGLYRGLSGEEEQEGSKNK